MNFRTTSIIFGIVICMLFIFGIAVVQNQPPDEGYLFPEMRTNDKVEITTVVLEAEIEGKRKKYKFTQEKDGSWIHEHSKNEIWRIEPTRMDQIVRQVKDARENERADVGQDLSAAGLNPGEIKVILRDKSGEEWWLELGKKSGDELNWFVRSSERPNKVIAVETTSIDAVNVKDVNELRSRILMEVTPQKAEFLAITKLEKGKETKQIVFDHTETGLWRFDEPEQYGFEVADYEGAGKKKDRPGLKKLLDEIGAIRVEEVEDFEHMGNRTLSDYGLVDGKESLRIEAKFSEPGKKGTVKEVLLVGRKKKDEYYVRMTKDQYVAKVDAEKFDLIFKVLEEPELLRSRDLAHFDREDPDAIDIEWPRKSKEVVKLREIDDEWEMFAGGKSYKANHDAISKEDTLIDRLIGSGKVKEFFDAADKEEAEKLDKKFGFDDPLAKITVYAGAIESDDEDKKESDEKEKNKKDKDGDKEDKDAKDVAPKPKKDSKVVTLIFGNKEEDRNLLYVKRIASHGKKEVINRLAVPFFMISEIDPAEGWLAFLENSLPELDTSAVKKVELVRDSGKFLIELQKKPKKKDDEDKKDKNGKDKEEEEDLEEVWTRVEPKDLPKQGVDEDNLRDVLDQLQGLEVVKWKEKIDPMKEDELDDFGLKKPKISITLHLKEDKDDKGETKEYKFGNNGSVGKTKGVYALATGTDIVFLVPEETVEFFQDIELRGRQVLEFDPKEVIEVKLKGWRNVYKDIVPTLTIQRAAPEEEWEFLGTDIEPDPTKATLLVSKLSGLETTKYIVLQGGPSSKHKLSDKEAALRITLKMKKSKKDEDEDKEKENEPIMLTIGALNKEKSGYFARAQGGKVPDDVVFLLAKDDFKDLLDKGMRYFAVKSEEDEPEEEAAVNGVE